MKLRHLLESSDAEIKEWFHHNLQGVFEKYIEVKNGVCNYMGITCEVAKFVKEIKYPLGTVNSFRIETDANELDGGYAALNSTKNFPKKCLNSLFCTGTMISKIEHPIQSDETISLALNKLSTLKNIHKFVKCKKMIIFNNPVKENILGLILIPGIEKIDDGRDAPLEDEYEDFHKALAIVAKYAGQGMKGVVKAQRELLENDLDDFADV